MSLDLTQMTHLKQLEAESIQIFREVAAEFENPVDPRPDAQFNVEIETKVEKFCLEQVHFHWGTQSYLSFLAKQHQQENKYGGYTAFVLVYRFKCSPQPLLLR